MFPQTNSLYANYNSYATSATSAAEYPYLLNQTHSVSAQEFQTLDGLASEWYYLYGSDLIFLPRETNKEETTFGEYLSAVFNKGIPIRMFIEEVEAWSGNGDMYSKFGLQVTDECTLWCNTSFFTYQTSGVYPKQSDLVYVVKSKKLFQISHIENEISPHFYRLGNSAGYKIQCKMFSYNHEVISQEVSSGIPPAIQALDGLLSDLAGNSVPLEDKEINHNNIPIIQNANPIINTSENDPLLG